MQRRDSISLPLPQSLVLPNRGDARENGTRERTEPSDLPGYRLYALKRHRDRCLQSAGVEDDQVN